MKPGSICPGWYSGASENPPVPRCCTNTNQIASATNTASAASSSASRMKFACDCMRMPSRLIAVLITTSATIHTGGGTPGSKPCNQLDTKA